MRPRPSAWRRLGGSGQLKVGYGRSLFTDQERQVLSNEAVKEWLDRYRRDRSPYNRHQLTTALVLAGLGDRRARDKLIETLMRTRRWGDNG